MQPPTLLSKMLPVTWNVAPFRSVKPRRTDLGSIVRQRTASSPRLLLFPVPITPVMDVTSGPSSATSVTFVRTMPRDGE